MFFQFFNSNIGYVCICYLRPYHPVVIAVIDVLCFDKGMGALSDAEGKKLSDAVGALSPKMSEKAFRDSIGKIRNQLESKLSTVKKQFDYQEPVQNMPGQQSTTGSNFSSLWGD